MLRDNPSVCCADSSPLKGSQGCRAPSGTGAAQTGIARIPLPTPRTRCRSSDGAVSPISEILSRCSLLSDGSGGLQPKTIETSGLHASCAKAKFPGFCARPPKKLRSSVPQRDNPSVTFGDSSPYTGEPGRAAQRCPYGNVVFVIPPLSLLPKRTAAWFSELLNKPGRAQRARRRSSLVLKPCRQNPRPQPPNHP